MALTTYYSNRLEILADELSHLISRPLRSPFAAETVIVQSGGMARWLSMRLAQRLGVMANMRFPFPAEFLWQTLCALLPEVAQTSAYDRPILTWRVMKQLQSLSDDPSYAPLHHYLQNSDALRCFQLAWRIADSFDQYLVYRPDWITAWERGEGEHWQATLWRELVRSGDEPHRVELQSRFLEKLAALDSAPENLPQRVSLLGISALAPVQLELLAQLADVIDVHLFLLNPCQEYWGVIMADRDIARHSDENDPAGEYLEVGNPLLASLGKQGRDFIDLIQLQSSAEFEHYQAPAEVDLLSCIQADILHLRRRGENTPKTPIADSDRSLQIHACHSAIREVEVLHDQLLALFEADAQLRPADVVVMTPDIEAYSPVIEAVFDSIRGERRIPFSIADRSPLNENPLVGAFVQLLDLASSRFEVSRLLALLEITAIRRRFELSEDDLSRIHHWLRETGVRWGIDRDDRATLELPALHEHSWRAGLERLLLGFALPGANIQLHRDILPYDDIEGSNAQALGKLQSFVEAAFALRELADARSMSDWSTTLHQLIEQFFTPHDSEQEQLQSLRSAIERLKDGTGRAVYERPLPLEVIKAALQRELTETAGAGGFFSGSVTFCTLVPMRSIPFRVVCLIGMNNDSYPRPQRPPDFDLLTQSPRRGDRSRRQDDRYLFLEALISARHCFYLSYIGSNIRDNSIIPPSVLVSELRDIIDQGFCSETGATLQHIFTRHPLQAFSRRYFEKTSNSALFSYSQELAALSRQATQTRSEPDSFIGFGLSEPEPDWRQLELDGLIRFFHHPARFLLRERLGIQLQTATAPLPDHEPFVLDGLEAYQLRQSLLALRLTDQSPEQSEAIVRGSGVLPHGQVGATLFTTQWQGVQQFAGRLQRFLPATVLQPLPLDLNIAGIRLSGRLTQLSAQGLFGYRLAAVTARDYLGLWLQHLLLNVLQPDAVQPVSRWLGQDREVILRPVDEAQRYLETLLSLYWQGLSKPLVFFPKTAFAYVEAAANSRARMSPEDKARQVWEGNERAPGEKDDPYYRLAFRGHNPLDDEFVMLAKMIAEPIFEHLQEESSR